MRLCGRPCLGRPLTVAPGRPGPPVGRSIQSIGLTCTLLCLLVCWLTPHWPGNDINDGCSESNRNRVQGSVGGWAGRGGRQHVRQKNKGPAFTGHAIHTFILLDTKTCSPAVRWFHPLLGPQSAEKGHKINRERCEGDGINSNLVDKLIVIAFPRATL